MGQPLGQLTGDFCRFASSGGGERKMFGYLEREQDRLGRKEAGVGQCSDLHRCIFFACRYSG